MKFIENEDDDIDKYQCKYEEIIGKGGYSKCYKVEKVKERKVYAGKVCSFTTKGVVKNIENEIKIHSELDHKNIIKMEEIIRCKSKIFIIMELAEKGNLIEYLKKEKRIEEGKCIKIMKEIFEGVKYLHDKFIIHRDLKLSNILLSENDDIKICDFGFSANIQYPQQLKNDLVGTPNYIAPEILKAQGHSFPADIWSCGVMFYTLLYGKAPFESQTVKETYINIKNLKYNFPSNISVSSDCKELISNILSLSPSDRPTINHILAHKLFK